MGLLRLFRNRIEVKEALLSTLADGKDYSLLQPALAGLAEIALIDLCFLGDFPDRVLAVAQIVGLQLLFLFLADRFPYLLWGHCDSCHNLQGAPQEVIQFHESFSSLL